MSIELVKYLSEEIVPYPVPLLPDIPRYTGQDTSSPAALYAASWRRKRLEYVQRLRATLNVQASITGAVEDEELVTGLDVFLH